jgi:hypothetical protein
LRFGKIVREAFDNDFEYSILRKRKSMEVGVAFGQITLDDAENTYVHALELNRST